MAKLKSNFFNRHKTVRNNFTQELLIDPHEALKDNLLTCSWPNLYYDRLDTVIKICQPELFVEIGVAYGYHAADVLSKNNQIKYVGVDPYVYNYDPNDGFCKDVENLLGRSGQQAMDLLYETVNFNLNSQFIDRAKIIRSASVDACLSFEDKTIDFLFVDGDHRFEAVLEDCRNWYPKIKDGGVMVGDDWNWKSVSDAVKKFTKDQNLEVILLQDTKSDHTLWLIRKGNLEI